MTPQTPRQQVRAMQAIIRRDATGRYELLDENGELCATGGLARACGIPDHRLRGPSAWRYKRIWRVIVTRFPILRTRAINAYDFVDLNDFYADLAERHQALCEFLERLLKKKAP